MYLTRSQRSLVRYQVKQENRNSISTSSHILFLFNMFKAKARQSFPKISEDCQRFPKISEEEPMIFRSYNDASNFFLRDYVTIAMVFF